MANSEEGPRMELASRYSLLAIRLCQRLEKRLVSVVIHQLVELGGVRDLQFEEPARAFGICIDSAWCSFELGIDGDHLACDRGIDFARGLDGFHHGGLLALADLLADGRELDIDDVAELRLSVVADADRAG